MSDTKKKCVWVFNPSKLKALPRANYIVERLPDDEQPRLSTIIETPNNYVTTMITRYRVLNAGPGNLYNSSDGVYVEEPRAKVGDIVTAFQNGMVELKHLGNDIFLLPEMNMIYVEPSND